MPPQPLLLASLLVRTARLAETVRQARFGESLRRAARHITRTAPGSGHGIEAIAGSLVSAAAALALVLGLDAAR